MPETGPPTSGRHPPGGIRYVHWNMPTTTRTPNSDSPPWMVPAADCEPPMCHLSVPDAVMLRACCSGDSVAIVEELPEIEALIALGMGESVTVRDDAAAKQDMRKCAEKLSLIGLLRQRDEWDDGDRRDMGYVSSRLYKLMGLFVGDPHTKTALSTCATS